MEGAGGTPADPPADPWSVLDAVPGVLALADAEGIVQWVSGPVQELSGYVAEDLVGSNMLDHVDLTWNPWSLESIAYAWETPGPRLPTVLRFISKDGTPILVEATSNNQLANPSIKGVLTQLRPCEERSLVDQILESLASGDAQSDTLARIHAVAACETLRSDAAVLVHVDDDVGPTFEVVASSGSAAALTRDVEGTPWAMTATTCAPVILTTLAELPPAIAEAATEAGYRACWTFPVDCRTKDDGAAAVLVFWRREEGPPEPSATMLAERLARLAALVLERFESARRLLHAASHDPLTGLANRVQFFEHLNHHLASADPSIGVLYLDLDGFKAINDRFGHGRGDAVLTDIGRRLHAAVRPGDLVARLGGDEFAVSCPGADQAALVAVAERIIAMVPLDVPDADGRTPLRVGVSVGLVATAPGSYSSDVIVDAADRALLTAKAHAKGTWQAGTVGLSPPG